MTAIKPEELDRLRANLDDPVHWKSRKGEVGRITDMPTAYRDNAAKLLLRHAHALYMAALREMGMDQLEVSPITWMTPESYVKHTPGYQALVNIDPVVRLLTQGEHWKDPRTGEDLPIPQMDLRLTRAVTEWLGGRYGTESMLYEALAEHQRLLEAVSAYFEQSGYVCHPGDNVAISVRNGMVHLSIERDEQPVLTLDMTGSYQSVKKSLTTAKPRG